MATTSPASNVLEIGETAGLVWAALKDNGPLSLAKTVKAVGRPRDLVMQALGWLAREDKIWIEDDGRSRVVSLRCPSHTGFRRVVTPPSKAALLAQTWRPARLCRPAYLRSQAISTAPGAGEESPILV